MEFYWISRIIRPPPGWRGGGWGSESRALFTTAALWRRWGGAGAALERRLSGAVFNLSNKTRLENPLERRWSGAGAALFSTSLSFPVLLKATKN